MIFLKCKYHKNTWKKIWNSTKATYDKDEVLKPNHLNDNTLEIREIQYKYVENQVEFICELPLINGKDLSSGNECVKNPYRKQKIIQVNEFSKEQI